MKDAVLTRPDLLTEADRDPFGLPILPGDLEHLPDRDPTPPEADADYKAWAADPERETMDELIGNSDDEAFGQFPDEYWR